MFEVGFTEMVMIAVVALLVLGPERLPKAARFAGLWVRKARSQWFAVKAEFEREVAAEEWRKQAADVDAAARDAAEAARAALRDAEAPPALPPSPTAPPDERP